MDYKTSTSEGILSRSPRVLNTLSKLSNTSRQSAQVANILRCYIETPVVVSGRSLVDTDSEASHRAKYHNTYSIAEISRQNTILGSAESLGLRNISLKNDRQNLLNPKTDISKSANSKTMNRPVLLKQNTDISNSTKSNNVGLVPLVSDRKMGNITESKYNYSYAISESLTSARSSVRLPKFTDEYFDALELPGHFNTRGIYGQKASMAPFAMRRSSSDLNLSNFQPRVRMGTKPETSLRWKLRSRERTLYVIENRRKISLPVSKTKIRRKSVKQKLPEVPQLQLPNENKQSKSETKIQKENGGKVVSLNVKLGEMLDEVGALKVNNSLAKVKQKRISVDASVQTDIEIDDGDEFIF